MYLYKNQLIRKTELLEQDITEMYQLVDSFYDNMNPKEFLRTLAKKDYVFLVRSPYGAIRAFTTIQLFQILGRKPKSQGILLGDIITHQNFAGEKNLIWEVLVRFEQIPSKYVERYVFLTCRDCWTYHAFQDSFNRFYPSEEQDTPIYIKRILNLFGEYYFNGEYEIANGIIKNRCFPRKMKESRRKMREDAMARDAMKKGENAYFLMRNPGFADGDGLICIAELAERKQMESMMERLPLANMRP